MNPIKTVFGDKTFTPKIKQERFPSSWPTPNELVRLGKRIIWTSRNNLGQEFGEIVFQPRFWNESGIF
jgi:hypothetical protein